MSLLGYLGRLWSRSDLDIELYRCTKEAETIWLDVELAPDARAAGNQSGTCTLKDQDEEHCGVGLGVASILKRERPALDDRQCQQEAMMHVSDIS